jgi:hypothetical protein
MFVHIVSHGGSAMIEQKLIVGRYIELNTPAPTMAGPAANGFQEVQRVTLNIAESKSSSSPLQASPTMPGFNPNLRQRAAIARQRAGRKISSQFHRQRTSETGVGASVKVHRNFAWLEWLAGLVSEVRPNGMDILTGPMSGCWITAYIRGGINYVGHVGTDLTYAHPHSVAARTAWNNFTAGALLGSYSGFNPFNDPWIGTVPTAQAGEANRKTFALVTGSGEFYTIIAYPQLHKPTRIRIAGIQQNHSTLPADGQI